MKVVVMGMGFDSESVPDFGSIYATKHASGDVKGINEYGLESADVEKLDLITNAACGSTALCDDTGDIYRLTKSGWVKFGDRGNSDNNETNNDEGDNIVIVNNADTETLTAMIEGTLESIANTTATTVGRCCFFGRDSLLKADFAAVTTLGQNCFANSNLETLIIRAPQVVTFVNGNPFSGTWIDDGEGEIYVPDELVDAYKADSNWSVYASEIKGLSEYQEE